jgi:hypothetical protein
MTAQPGLQSLYSAGSRGTGTTLAAGFTATFTAARFTTRFAARFTGRARRLVERLDRVTAMFPLSSASSTFASRELRLLPYTSQFVPITEN